MAGIVFDFYDVSGDYEAEPTIKNITGSPISSVVTDGFTEYTGVFRLTFETTTTVTVTAPNDADTAHPLLPDSTVTVACDGSTENGNVIPGLGIVFAAGTAAGDVGEIGLVSALNSSSEWLRTLAFGAQVPGFTSSTRRFKVRNDSGESLLLHKLYATNAVRVENDQARDQPFIALWQQGEGNPTADTDLGGAAVVFTVTGDDGGVPLVEMRIGGVLQTVAEYADGSGTTTTMRAETDMIYRFQSSSKYDSVFFSISPDVESDDSATLFVSPGGDLIELSLEDGEWTSGPVGISLPTIADGEAETVKIRAVPALSDDGSMNLNSFSLRATLDYDDMGGGGG